MAERAIPIGAHPSCEEGEVKTKCGVCGKPLGSFETIHVAEKGPRCYPCFNREMAEHTSPSEGNASPGVQPMSTMSAPVA